MILINKKDKTEVLYAIYFTINNTYFTYATLETPIVLPANGSCTVYPDDVTYYTRNNKPFNMSYYLANNGDESIGIYLKTSKKIYRSYPDYQNSELNHFERKAIEAGGKFVFKHNGVVVPKDALYAIDYKIGDEEKVSFILKNGFIKWSYFPNLIVKLESSSSKELEEVLRKDKDLSFMKYIFLTKIQTK
ncbi:hypothetical protein AA102526_0048 [Asaia lannensis NBRC 102526]|nr:hypothetical protein AA102526_0048 [Asaia lannensis NBRC 102526]